MKTIKRKRTMTDPGDRASFPSTEEIEEAFRRLERDGLIKRNGEFRNGKPVYVASEHYYGTA